MRKLKYIPFAKINYSASGKFQEKAIDYDKSSYEYLPIFLGNY